jgi:RNA polymerase-binding transcription factor DksA
VDDADWATAIAEWERRTLVARRSHSEVEPSSGVCADCGEPIEPGRLAALPGATHCAFCAGAGAEWN